MNANELYDYLTFQRLLSNRISINVFDKTGCEFYITETENVKKFKIEILSDYSYPTPMPLYNTLSYFPKIEFPVRFTNEPK